MNVSIYRSIVGQYENLRTVNSVPMMNTISHSMEQQVINHQMPINFYAGFERFSRFPDQTRLYGRLASVARRVYVFGVPDVKPTPISGVEYIPLEPNSPLAREWFLIVDTPDFWALLATEEVSGEDEATGGRKFNGIWTFDHVIVERASLLISQVLGSVYQPVRQRNYEQQNIHVAEIGAGMIARLDKVQVEKRRNWAQANTLYYVIDILAKAQNSLDALKQIANTLFTVFGASGVSILISTQSDRYAVVASEGETAQTSGAVKLSDSPTSRAVSQGASITISNMRQEREREPLMPTSQALLAIPLVGKQGVHGALLIGHLDSNRWTEQDQKVAEAIAGLLGMWIETLATNTNVALPASTTVTTSTSEEASARLRLSLNQMMTLHSILRLEGSPTPRQNELLTQLDRLTMDMAQQVSSRRTQLEMTPINAIEQPKNSIFDF